MKFNTKEDKNETLKMNRIKDLLKNAPAQYSNFK